jgi:hypothetical protein
MTERDDAKRPHVAEVDPDAPPTEEEIAASARLRDALEDPSIPHDDADLARSLGAAYGSGAMDDAELRALVDAMLDPAEVAAASALRDAVEAKRGDGSDEASLARALSAAWAPSDIGDAEHRAIVAKALERVPARSNVIELRRARVVRVAVAVVTGGLAIAASVLFVIQQKPVVNEAPLARARSTQPLFAEPFKAGEASARIDKIAVARASDYRDNRFAKWGVR